jgi:ribosomal protein S18 acetylase RimI-like enzyme
MTTIRRATPDDGRAIAEVKVETWREVYAGVMPQATLDGLDVDEHAPLWSRYAAAAEVGMFVAEEHGRIVGFVSVGPCDDLKGTGELYAIYVRPGSWGTGAGLALMETGVTCLSERWTEAVLWVAEDNPRARRFYELYGWTPETTRVEEVAPGARISEVRYRLSGLDQR